MWVLATWRGGGGRGKKLLLSTYIFLPTIKPLYNTSTIHNTYKVKQKMQSVLFRDTFMHSVLSISILENIQYWFQLFLFFCFLGTAAILYFHQSYIQYPVLVCFYLILVCPSIIIHSRSFIDLIFCLHSNIINHNRSFIAVIVFFRSTQYLLFNHFFYLKYIFLWHGCMATHSQSCGSGTFLYGSGSGIHTTNLLIRIQLRILLFCQWLTRCQQKLCFFQFFLLFTF